MAAALLVEADALDGGGTSSNTNRTTRACARALGSSRALAARPGWSLLDVELR